MATRGSPVAWDSFYKTARWRRLRKFQLMQHPLCKFCLQRGIVTRANVVDHVVPHKGDWTDFITGVAALALTFAISPGAAQQWTPKQRAACEPDSMRLCNQYVPDIQNVRDCMSHYRRYLSPACRAVFQGGAKRRVRRFRR